MTAHKKLFLLCIAVLLAFAFGCSSSPTKEGTGEYIDDAAITAKVKTAIVQNSSLMASEVNVETFKGVVQLSGFVASQAEATAAADVARKVPGVKDVRNDIRIKGQQ